MKVQLAIDEDLTAARLGNLDPAKVRRVELDGVVDSGATHVALPTAVADQLGLRRVGKATLQYADHRRVQREVVADLDLTVKGRNGVFKATLEPDRTAALIGAIVMEDLDFLIDCKDGTLRPRDPAMPLYEIG